MIPQNRVFDTTSGTSAEQLPQSYPSAYPNSKVETVEFVEVEPIVQERLYQTLSLDATKGPWLPEPEEVAQIREDLDAALSPDLLDKLAHSEPVEINEGTWAESLEEEVVSRSKGPFLDDTPVAEKAQKRSPTQTPKSGRPKKETK